MFRLVFIMSLISSLLSWFTPASATQFHYDAVEAKTKRAEPVVTSQSEDWILEASKRAKLLANSRDLHRNFSIAAWAIRRHIDYVCTFNFHARTGDENLDTQIEELFRESGKAKNFDHAKRHRRDRFLRLAEIRRVLDGDIALLRLNNGRIQGIEGDRIKTPGTTASNDWTHGIRHDIDGTALEYAIWSRRRSTLSYEKTLPAQDVFLLGYFDRFDQLRGISPLASGLNSLRDVYEGIDYALAKTKIQQLFALVFYRDGNDALGEIESDEAEGKAGYSVDFGRGPISLDLNAGDRAEFLESKQPSSEFQAFSQLVLMIALKSLDIPFSFFDESHTNFFGSRGAWLHYDRACRSKRDDLVEFLDWYTEHRLTLAILDGEISIPRGFDPKKMRWEWVASGVPWWDPAKEINGSVQAIAAGLDNPERIAKAGGGDVYEHIDATARVQEYARQKGVTLKYDAVTINDLENGIETDANRK
jgi:capsid protein